MGRLRVGILGTGLIGSLAAKIFKDGLDCDVVAYDAFPSKKISDPAPDGLGIPYLPLEEFFKTCDVISLHAPLIEGPNGTKHIVNMDAVKMMKPGVTIINTSRGPLIDTKALIWGIREGIIADVGLDVVEGEGPSATHLYSQQALFQRLQHLLSWSPTCADIVTMSLTVGQKRRLPVWRATRYRLFGKCIARSGPRPVAAVHARSVSHYAPIGRAVFR